MLRERVVTLPSALRVVLLELDSVVDFWIGFICPASMPSPAASAERVAGSTPPDAAGAFGAGATATGVPGPVGSGPAATRFSYSFCSYANTVVVSGRSSTMTTSGRPVSSSGP